MPSFQGAPSNPLGQIWLEGAAQGDRVREVRLNAQLEREKMGNQYAIAQMETETRRQALQQQAQQAQMEIEAQQQALQQQMAMKSQELNFEKAYRDSMIGLGESEQTLKEKQYQFDVDQAASQAAKQREIQDAVESMMWEGVPQDKALETALSMYGAAAGPNVRGAMGDILARGAAGGGATIPEGIEYGKMYPVEGYPGYTYARTGPHSTQFFEPKAGSPVVRDVPFDQTKGVYGTRVMDRPQEREAVKLEKEVAQIRKAMNSAEWAAKRQSVEKAKDPKAELTLGDKSRIQEWKTQQEELKRKLDQIDELRRFMKQNPASSSTNAPSGTSSLRILNIRQK